VTAVRRLTLILMLLAVASCGAPEEEQVAATPTPVAEQAGPTAPSDFDRREKPDIEVPDGDPPKELEIDDLEEGGGAEAEEGATVTIDYAGVSWSTGEEFDSSFEGPQPATFPLGNLIPCWQEGIPGMKEGGRRRLTCPPDLAYGEQGRPGIAPNETLIFVIDLHVADAA
jgi:peptidylprolyl isomerase